MKLEVLKYLPESNSGEMPLLFIHGACHGAWCWKENFLPYFVSKGYPAYALSLRGHGKSEGREKIHSFSLQNYLDDVLNTIASLKNKPVLIGHSLGGGIIQKMLYLHPDKMQAAVLMASIPPNGMWKESFRLLFTNFRECMQMSSFFRGRDVEFPARLFFSEELSVEKRNEFAGLLHQESIKATMGVATQFVPKSISAEVPILILGSEKDVMISKKTTIDIGKMYKTKPIIFPTMSHDMMLDPKWEVAAEQILTFLHEFADKRVKKRAKEE